MMFDIFSVIWSLLLIYVEDNIVIVLSLYNVGMLYVLVYLFSLFSIKICKICWKEISKNKSLINCLRIR